MKIDPQLSFGKTVVAVEPGTEWFKLVQVSRGKDGPLVDKTILKRMSEVESHAGPDFLKIVGAPELAGTTVIVCLPRQLVNVRLFDLPSGDQQEIADMVDLQIARQTPYSRDEIVFDYRLFRSDKEGYTRVMLMIAQIGVVRQKCAFLEASGLSVGMITVTTDGWLAAIEEGRIPLATGGSDVVALLDGDSAAGDFIVLNRGTPLFSRTITSPAEAESEESIVKHYIAEVGRALETFRNETPAVQVKTLALAGSASRQGGLVNGLKSALVMDVSTVDGIEQLAREHLSVAENKSVSLVGVLGAASSPKNLQLNLMPESVQLRKSVMLRARQLTGMGVLVLAIVGLVSLLVMSRIQGQESYLKELQSMIRETTPTVDEVEGMRRKMVVVSDRIASKLVPAKALVELYNVAGDSIAFSSIEIVDASQLECKGTAETVADVVKLVNTMEASPRFKNVKNTRTSSGKERTEFEIACELEKKRP